MMTGRFADDCTYGIFSMKINFCTLYCEAQARVRQGQTRDGP